MYRMICLHAGFFPWVSPLHDIGALLLKGLTDIEAYMISRILEDQYNCYIHKSIPKVLVNCVEDHKSKPLPSVWKSHRV